MGALRPGCNRLANRKTLLALGLTEAGYPQEALTSRGQIDAEARMLTKPYRKAELARRIREALDEPD